MRRNLTLSLSILVIAAAWGSVARAQGYQARMGEPIPGLTQAELNLFELSKRAFGTALSGSQGIGPIMNGASCGGCHSRPAVGGFSTQLATRFGIDGTPFDALDGTGPSGLDLGGSLLQHQVIAAFPQCAEVVPPEATITARRSTPHVFGAGFVQRISDADLIANETTPPGGHVTGKAHMVTPFTGGGVTVGRFGWKAGVRDMLQFSADASLNEMGITNRFLVSENAPNGDPSLLLVCDSVSDPEDSAALANSVLGTNDTLELIDYFDQFQQWLAVPPRTPQSGMTGELLFGQVGCADCHVPSFTSRPDANPVFDRVTFYPFSDFLLHDIGLGLGDGITEGMATGREMRTAPLWGMSQRVSLLHDGRATGGTFADNVVDAINEHGGEADVSRLAFQALTAVDRDHIVRFLSSLGRADFDVFGSTNDQDNRIDEFDWFIMLNHPSGGDLFTGPGSFYTPDDVGAICDVDADGDFDMRDYSVFMRAFTGS